MNKQKKLCYWLNLHQIWKYPLIVFFVDDAFIGSVIAELQKDEAFIILEDPYTLVLHLIYFFNGQIYHICLADRTLDPAYLKRLIDRSSFIGAICLNRS